MNPLRRRIHTAMQSGGGAAAFSPTDVAGLQLWLDASQIVGLNDGDAVATWSDLSGNALNFTQGSASARPIYKTGVQNGLPGVLGDGVDDVLESASVDWSAYDKATIFCAYKNPTPTSDEIVYERSVDLNHNNGGWLLFDNATAVHSGVKTTSGSYSTVTNAVASGVVVTKIDLALASNALTAKLNGSDFSGRAFDGSGGNFGNYANYLFRRAGGAAPLSGYILEMGVYMGEIGDSARTQLTTYLRNKWGY